MTRTTFDIDADDAAFQARKKTLEAQQAAHRTKIRNTLGNLVLTAGIANGRTPEALVGSWLWAIDQLRANPTLAKEWERIGATFLNKSRASGGPGGDDEAGASGAGGNSGPAGRGERDRGPDARPADLLTGVAAQ